MSSREYVFKNVNILHESVRYDESVLTSSIEHIHSSNDLKLANSLACWDSNPIRDVLSVHPGHHACHITIETRIKKVIAWNISSWQCVTNIKNSDELKGYERKGLEGKRKRMVGRKTTTRHLKKRKRNLTKALKSRTPKEHYSQIPTRPLVKQPYISKQHGGNGKTES